ncbi:exosortase system-associated protein, TIGR04073 family [Methylomicrobium sp. Wu6]|uniref:exosortase system-associated protein, TIGR04073 family n=1 Tax=Methylomicrobium sp. Wu6 TaxID=3107928 RepID=UPI002DD61CD1|nr:exosortase system-associated protein, TIGR04073 family [Methylomicrobium sp. Wu6]MEC4749689.1 exosortase system-associated protein, TIGR04073 family [Methylomicrobium sp. Wu6]
MMTFFRFFASLSLVCLTIAYAPLTEAEPMSQEWEIDAPAKKIPTKPQSYGERVEEKALNSFANIATGWLEMPKNVINTTNQSNIIYGFIGGLAKGMIHTAGRMGVGIAELVTLPIATDPIIYPLYIWDNFNVDTVYGNVMQVQEQQQRQAPVVEIPPAPQAAEPVAPAPVSPQSAQMQYPTDTNRKIDAIFKDKMLK